MQYILTEDEYNQLKTKKDQLEQIDKDKLQKLCTEIADTMPVKRGWGSPDPKPWHCILTSDNEWYCDKCPVQYICPNENKHWSN